MQELEKQNNPDATLTPDESSGGQWHWYSWQVILLVLNAVFGLILFEWAWHKTKRMRELEEKMPDLHKIMPAFRRTDVHKWRKWRFYPGAMTVVIPRFVLSIFSGLMPVI